MLRIALLFCLLTQGLLPSGWCRTSTCVYVPIGPAQATLREAAASECSNPCGGGSRAGKPCDPSVGIVKSKRDDQSCPTTGSCYMAPVESDWLSTHAVVTIPDPLAHAAAMIHAGPAHAASPADAAPRGFSPRDAHPPPVAVRLARLCVWRE